MAPETTTAPEATAAGAATASCCGGGGSPVELRVPGDEPAAVGCCGEDSENHYGYADHKQDYLRRLRRIEGQVRGLQRMVDEDQYCIDILTQISAVTKALESTALRLLDEHLSHCVSHAIAEGGQEADDKLAEASAAIARLVRS